MQNHLLTLQNCNVTESPFTMLFSISIKPTNFRVIWPKKRIEVLQNWIKFEKQRNNREAKEKRKLRKAEALVDIQVDKCSCWRRSAKFVLINVLHRHSSMCAHLSKPFEPGEPLHRQISFARPQREDFEFISERCTVTTGPFRKECL